MTPKYRMLDLFAGTCSVAKVFAERGWECVCVDLVRPQSVPDGCEFVTCDVLQLGAMKGRIGVLAEIFGFLYSWPIDFVWASSPCEEFSLFGMRHFFPDPPHPEHGIKLFNHTRRLCESTEIPFVMENVRSAQQFVGDAVHHCGPFYLWGNAVPPVVPQGICKGFDHAQRRSESERRRSQPARIPPELANCVADYAERLLEQKQAEIVACHERTGSCDKVLKVGEETHD